MGQYLKGDKIGTCECMYYLNLKEAQEFAAKDLHDDDGCSFREYLKDNTTRFRFAWPDEDNTIFEVDGNKREPFKTFALPCGDVEVNHDQKVVHMALPQGGNGFNVWLPCPYSKEFNFKTSIGGVGMKFINIEFQAMRDGQEKTIFKCPHCGQSQRFSDDDVNKIRKESIEYYSVYKAPENRPESGNQSLYGYAMKVIERIK
jgi:hypothetical protein